MALNGCHLTARIGPSFLIFLPEMKRLNLHSQIDQHNSLIVNFANYSNLTKLERTIDYCIRFGLNCRSKNRFTGPLTITEINRASLFLIKLSQMQSFEQEIDQISSGAQIKKGGQILNLNPFVDETGILSVSGRLSHSEFNYNKKHPIILSAKHKFTELLFSGAHLRLLHAGPQLLLANIREEFWPLGGRNLGRKITRNCGRCFRSRPSELQPMMGDLTSKRVNPAPPFYTCGVDYAGPILIRDRQCR